MPQCQRAEDPIPFPSGSACRSIDIWVCAGSLPLLPDPGHQTASSLHNTWESAYTTSLLQTKTVPFIGLISWYPFPDRIRYTGKWFRFPSFLYKTLDTYKYPYYNMTISSSYLQCFVRSVNKNSTKFRACQVVCTIFCNFVHCKQKARAYLLARAYADSFLCLLEILW